MRRASLNRVYAELAVILLALAAFSVLSFRVAEAPRGPRDQQLQGFLYVGAAAVTALAAAVILVGLLGNGSGRAESLAMFGFFTYAIYLAGALLLNRWAGRRRH